MAFFGLSVAKEDVSRRAAPGQGSIAFPVTGLREAPLRLPGCTGCSKRDAHNPCSGIGIQIPHGEHRYQRVPIAQRPDVLSMNVIQSALAIAGYVAWGNIGDNIILNANAANNASQTVDAEIVGASGTTLTLTMNNPKLVAIGTSRVNPEYPLPDPETGTTGAIVFGEHTQVLPVGAAIEFDPPSCLAGRLAPLITKVFPPATNDTGETTFTVEVSADVSAARKPADLFYPPPRGRYTCKVRWEALAPSAWGNYQAPRETAFTVKVLEFTELGTYALTNTAGGACRILWPGVMLDAITVELVRRAGGSDFMDEGEIAERLDMLDPAPGSWSTSIDLTDIDTVTYERAIVTYHPEAIASDSLRIQFQSGCSNAQRDPSGSYTMVGTHRCTAPGSTGFSTFRGDRCYKPGSCSAFALGDGAQSYGGLQFPPTDMGDANLLSSLWSRSSWIIEQGVPGLASHFNFRLRKPNPGGPSIEALCGSYCDEVPTGYFPRRQLFFGPAWGKRVEYSDETGTHHGLVFGAFYSREEFTAGTTPATGCVAAALAGWTSKNDARGDVMDAGLALLPHRLTGRTSVYSYEHSASSMGKTNELVQVEAIVSGCSLSGAEDTAVTAAVRARFS